MTSLGPQLSCVLTHQHEEEAHSGQWCTAPVSELTSHDGLMTVQTCLVGESPAMRLERLMRHLESTVPVSPLTKVSEQAHEALLDDVASQTYEEAPSSARAVTDWSL